MSIREKQIEQAAQEANERSKERFGYLDLMSARTRALYFTEGAKWADLHPDKSDETKLWWYDRVLLLDQKLTIAEEYMKLHMPSVYLEEYFEKIGKIK